jgi:type IV secretion system protein VirD4
MVSRQETARPLLTPGEVMQLPPGDEVVMASGHPPIRAAKLRYHEDRNFTLRILPPPQLAQGRYYDCPHPRTDDWSELGPLAESTARHDAACTARSSAEDDGGLERRPELDPVVAIANAEPVGDDLAARDDTEDFEDESIPSADPRRRPDRRLQRAARLATLDPRDGIPL